MKLRSVAATALALLLTAACGTEQVSSTESSSYPEPTEAERVASACGSTILDPQPVQDETNEVGPAIRIVLFRTDKGLEGFRLGGKVEDEVWLCDGSTYLGTAWDAQTGTAKSVCTEPHQYFEGGRCVTH